MVEPPRYTLRNRVGDLSTDLLGTVMTHRPHNECDAFSFDEGLAKPGQTVCFTGQLAQITQALPQDALTGPLQ